MRSDQTQTHPGSPAALCGYFLADLVCGRLCVWDPSCQTPMVGCEVCKLKRGAREDTGKTRVVILGAIHFSRNCESGAAAWLQNCEKKCLYLRVGVN